MVSLVWRLDEVSVIMHAQFYFADGIGINLSQSAGKPDTCAAIQARGCGHNGDQIKHLD
jgi:hypothetical protein